MQFTPQTAFSEWRGSSTTASYRAVMELMTVDYTPYGYGVIPTAAVLRVKDTTGAPMAAIEQYGGSYATYLPNTSTGTVLNKTACFVGGSLQICPHTSTTGIEGIIQEGAGTGPGMISEAITAYTVGSVTTFTTTTAPANGAVVTITPWVTSSCAGILGVFTATHVNSTTFTVPVNSTALPPDAQGNTCTSATGVRDLNVTWGMAALSTMGDAVCVFDGAVTAGDFVQQSTGTDGDCHDTGSTLKPLTGDIIGRVLDTNGSAGTYRVHLRLQYQ
jgi:hypothetical protein